MFKNSLTKHSLLFCGLFILSTVILSFACSNRIGISGSVANTSAASSTDTSTTTTTTTPITSTSPIPVPTVSPKGGCTGVTSLLCDDFETGTVSPTLWTQNTPNGGKLTIDTAHAYSGLYSLHVHTTSLAGSFAYITETKTFPTTVSTLYGRYMMYVNAPTPISHAEFITAQSSSGSNYTLGDQTQTWISLQRSNGNESASHSAMALPTGTWVCVEFLFNGSGGTATYWINGNVVSDLTQTKWPTIQFSSLSFGISMFGTDTNTKVYDAWYDDIVVNTTRVGCP